MKINEKSTQNLQESSILLWRWTMRINALPNALGNALFPFGAEAQGGALPPPESPGGGYYPLYPPPEYASGYTYILVDGFYPCTDVALGLTADPLASPPPSSAYDVLDPG